MHGGLLYYQGMREEKSAKRIYSKSTAFIIYKLALKHVQ
jgi:hypothetical protein